MDEPRIRAQEKILDGMLLTLAAGGYVTLDPAPPPPPADGQPNASPAPPYSAVHAQPTPRLDRLLVFRSVHPLYASFLIDQLGVASPEERLQAFESMLEMPRPLLKFVRVPRPDDLPPGPLATTRLDPELIQRGLIAAPIPKEEAEDEEDDWREEERPPTLAEKLRLLFDALYPDVDDVHTQSVWCASELLRFGGNFNKYVQSRDLVKQEGIVFRHLLRLILLLGEFAEVSPSETPPDEWRRALRELADQLTASCRAVDPTSTDEMIQLAHAADVVEGEAPKPG
jgi:hypothetical protein